MMVQALMREYGCEELTASQHDTVPMSAAGWRDEVAAELTRQPLAQSDTAPDKQKNKKIYINTCSHVGSRHLWLQFVSYHCPCHGLSGRIGEASLKLQSGRGATIRRADNPFCALAGWHVCSMGRFCSGEKGV